MFFRKYINVCIAWLWHISGKGRCLKIESAHSPINYWQIKVGIGLLVGLLLVRGSVRSCQSRGQNSFESNKMEAYTPLAECPSLRSIDGWPEQHQLSYQYVSFWLWPNKCIQTSFTDMLFFLLATRFDARSDMNLGKKVRESVLSWMVSTGFDISVTRLTFRSGNRDSTTIIMWYTIHQ